MSKDHFPVNDKSIADVNAANTKAYDATSTSDAHKCQECGKKFLSGTALQVHYKEHENTKKIEPKKSGDHVRESSQEHGEAHDAEDSTPAERMARKNAQPTKFPHSVSNVSAKEIKQTRHEYAKHLSNERK